MEIYQIIHFIAIVETGSFTKGADRSAISQSAISASIAKLEAEFDVQLLDRRRSPVVPTDAGERLFEAGKAILQICNIQYAGFLPARHLSCGNRGVRCV